MSHLVKNKNITKMMRMMNTNLVILLVMRNSAQLMISLGKWQKRKTTTMQTRIPARFTSLWAEFWLRWDLT